MNNTRPRYRLRMVSPCGTEELSYFETPPDAGTIESQCDAFVRWGEWGPGGCLLECLWSLQQWDQSTYGYVEIESGTTRVHIEPDHKHLIGEAVGSYPPESFCGYDPDNHDWESTGVHSRGGTTYVEREQCCTCGLIRETVEYGAQRGPDQDDSVVYWIDGSNDKVLYYV